MTVNPEKWLHRLLIVLGISASATLWVACGGDDDDDDAAEDDSTAGDDDSAATGDDAADDDTIDDDSAGDDDATGDDDAADDDAADDDDEADDDDAADDDDELPPPTVGDFEENVSIDVCDPANGPFTTTGDNPFFPLIVGQVILLDSGDEQVRITTLEETEVVAGIETRVIEEYETEDGELAEISRNFFAQAPDGTVCYFGETVDDYANGEVVGHGGGWRAGEDGAVPGIIMPADAQVGQMYRQEVASGVAEDRAYHTAMGEEYTTPLGTYTDTLTVQEDSPIELGAFSLKVYARGIGMIFDDGAELTEESH